MDQLYLSLLERPIVGAQFVLDLKAGMESMAYPEDSAPYFAGEMVTVWKMPPVKRLDTTRVIHGMPPWDTLPGVLTRSRASGSASPDTIRVLTLGCFSIAVAAIWCACSRSPR